METQPEGQVHTAAMAARCPHCAAVPPRAARRHRQPPVVLQTFLGICGSVSCYVAMFPTLLVSVVGFSGFSTLPVQAALDAYVRSPLFQPVLLLSLILLVLGLKAVAGSFPLLLALGASLGIFLSMNVLMVPAVFTLSFVLLAVAYVVAYRRNRARPLRTAAVLLSVIALLGLVDLARGSAAPIAAPPAGDIFLHPPAGMGRSMGDMP